MGMLWRGSRCRSVTITTAIVWDYTTDDEVLILTNYHTWNVEKIADCFPPAPAAPPTAIQGRKKRKKDESDDENVQDPVQLILRNHTEPEFNWQFALTSEIFYRWSLEEDFQGVSLRCHEFQSCWKQQLHNAHPHICICW